MNRQPLLFLGVLAALLLSWTSLVLAPQLQIGDEGMARLEDTGRDYPTARPGRAAQGAQVYRANGCQYCHTQVVRGARGGRDLARGWGGRRTVPRDYLRDAPVMLGSVRFGPDLANFGVRDDHRKKLLLKLYDPRLVTPGSLMPRYPYLFEERRLRPGARRSPEALELPEDYPLPKGVDEVVPRPEARMLAAYLFSLRAEPLFFEVFPPVAPSPATNAPAATPGTNASPAAATNEAGASLGRPALPLSSPTAIHAASTP